MEENLGLLDKTTCCNVIASILKHYDSEPKVGEVEPVWMNKIMHGINKMHERILELERFKAAYEHELRNRR